MAITASQLRQNIYKLLDECLEKGEEIEINRKGRIIRLVPETKKSKLDQLKNNVFSDDPPESFTSIDWTKEWTEGRKKR